jgi:hypothetical protein
MFTCQFIIAISFLFVVGLAFQACMPIEPGSPI